MRLVAVLVLGLLVSAPSAQAFEKFIPTGMGYSTEVSVLPELNSELQQQINQADVYETEIYNKKLEQNRQNSYIKHFLNDQNGTGSDFSVDY